MTRTQFNWALIGVLAADLVCVAAIAWAVLR